MTTTAQQAGHETARKVVLIGWVAKGVVYLALAYLVLQTAFGSAPQEASTTGALQYIAQRSPGKFALIVLGIGLLAYAVGRILEVTTLARSGVDAKDKAVGVVLALFYASLALTAFSIVGRAGSGSSGGGSSNQEQGSALLLGLPGGRVLVGLIGLAVIAFGFYEAYKGVKEDFLGTLRMGEMSSGMRSATHKIGTAAYVTKGAIYALLGFFLLQSALTYDPGKARGLDAALGEVSQQSWGRVVLALVALGLTAYAVFAFIESRYRRVGSSATGTT